MGGIAVVTNPMSRRNRRDPSLVRQLAWVLGEQGQIAAPGDLAALHAVVERFREREVDVVAVNGGDGTLHQVVTALVRVYGDAPLPRVAPLRGGTMNTVAGGLGIRGTPDQLLGRLVTRHAAGEALPVATRNLLRVQGGDAGELAGFIFGNGLLSQFLEAYYDSPDPSPAAAAWLLLRGAVSSLVGGELAARLGRRVEARVTVDGAELPERSWMTVTAATVDDIGLGFRPFWRVVEHPGTVEVLALSCSVGALTLQLPRIWLKRPVDHPGIREALCALVVLEADRPLSFMVDGDFHRGGQRVEITVGPRVELVLG